MQPELSKVVTYIDNYRQRRELIKQVSQVDELPADEWRLFTQAGRQIIFDTLGKPLLEPENYPPLEAMQDTIHTVLRSAIEITHDKKVSNHLLSILLECEASILSEEGKPILALHIQNLSGQIMRLYRLYNEI